MVRKFEAKTKTLLDNYPTFKAFTQDVNITPTDIKYLLDSPVYWS